MGASAQSLERYFLNPLAKINVPVEPGMHSASAFPNPKVHHKCHHSMCCLPWHMEWVPHNANIGKGYKRRRQDDYAPNPLA